MTAEGGWRVNDNTRTSASLTYQCDWLVLIYVIYVITIDSNTLDPHGKPLDQLRV